MDKKGTILIPGINEAVAPVTEEELELYDQIDFDLEEYARDVGAETLLHSCKVGAPAPARPRAWPRTGPEQATRWAGARAAGRDCASAYVPEPSGGPDAGKQHVSRLGIGMRRFLKRSRVDL